jgi:DNA-binding response OmpR family regulator
MIGFVPDDSEGAAATVYDDGMLRIDFVRREVTMGGTLVALDPTEYHLFVALVRHPGRVLSSEGLADLARHDENAFGRRLDRRLVKYPMVLLREKLALRWNSDRPPPPGLIESLNDEDWPIELLRGHGWRYRSPSE